MGSSYDGYLQQKARYSIGRCGWGGPLGSSYDSYLQQEARYAIGRWGLGGQLESSYDCYLHKDFLLVIFIDSPIAQSI